MPGNKLWFCAKYIITFKFLYLQIHWFTDEYAQISELKKKSRSDGSVYVRPVGYGPVLDRYVRTIRKVKITSGEIFTDKNDVRITGATQVRIKTRCTDRYCR